MDRRVDGILNNPLGYVGKKILPSTPFRLREFWRGGRQKDIADNVLKRPKSSHYLNNLKGLKKPSPESKIRPMTDVSCAIILEKGRVLVAQRSATMPLPLKWEFPGGKVEANETPQDALIREIKKS